MILFLDIDGVCNNTLNPVEFDSTNMANVKFLSDVLKAKIVLSSDWRRNPSNLAWARSEIEAIGLKLFDTTPIIPFRPRSYEIKEWLGKEKWNRALILDDLPAGECDPKMENVLFFQTNFRLGLTEEDVDSIIASLLFK